MRKAYYPIISFLVVIIIWQVAVTVFGTPSYILPSPLAVIRVWFNEMPTLVPHMLVTLMESVIGLVLAATFAFVIALLMDYWQLIYRSVYPMLVISQTLPMMVIGPLLTLWFGFGWTPKIILVILMSFFSIVVNFTQGLKSVPDEQMTLMRTMGASERQIYRLIKIPMAMDNFFAGLQIAATYAAGGAIIGEWLNAKSGLGYYMIRTNSGYQISRVFAAIIWVVILSLSLTGVTILLRKMYHHYLYRRNSTKG